MESFTTTLNQPLLTREEINIILDQGYDTEEDIVLYISIDEFLKHQKLIKQTKELHKKITSRK